MYLKGPETIAFTARRVSTHSLFLIVQYPSKKVLKEFVSHFTAKHLEDHSRVNFTRQI